jgi:diadenosine tetraphosphate (Ap4A) HIT family hydrolase
VSAAGFALDPRLAAGSAFVTDWPLVQVRLRHDARFPWLLLVPRRAGVSELHDLDTADRAALGAAVLAATRVVQDVAAPDKINVAMLGNVVAQMHVHVVGRRRVDAAWPGTVWAAGEAVAYAPDALAAALAAYRAACARLAPS